MSDTDWRKFKEAAILKRRREGRRSRPRAAVAFNYTPTKSSIETDFAFYYRWCWDNVLNLLSLASDDTQGDAAKFLYLSLLEFDSGWLGLLPYDRDSVTAPLVEEGE